MENEKVIEILVRLADEAENKHHDGVMNDRPPEEVNGWLYITDAYTTARRLLTDKAFLDSMAEKYLN